MLSDEFGALKEQSELAKSLMIWAVRECPLQRHIFHKIIRANSRVSRDPRSGIRCRSSQFIP